MTKKMTTAEFIVKAKLVHGALYDYSLTEYIGSHDYIKVGCGIHGYYETFATSHLIGRKCPHCAQLQRVQTKTLNFETDLLPLAEKIHNNLYDYSLVDYVKLKEKVIILCPFHGEFKQTMNNHIDLKQGCPKCAPAKISRVKREPARSAKAGRAISLAQRFTKDQFVERAQKIHGEKYNYDSVQYETTMVKVNIACSTHGSFFQTPGHHLAGQGCPKCFAKCSKVEQQWLDKMNIPEENRQVSVRLSDGSYIKADGFQDNTVYEFWGDFWHGNPDLYSPDKINPKTKTTFGELYEATLRKRQKILESGFNLVEIWESNFS